MLDAAIARTRAVLNVKYAVYLWRIEMLKHRKSHVINGDSSDRLAFRRAMMRVPMHGEHRPEPVNHFSQTRASEVWEYLRWLAFYSLADGRIMCDDDTLIGVDLHERFFQLHRFINACLDEGFDRSLPEGGQDPAAKSTKKTLYAREADSIAYIAAAIQHLDAFRDHKTREFFRLSALMVVISQHRNDRDTQSHQRSEK